LVTNRGNSGEASLRRTLQQQWLTQNWFNLPIIMQLLKTILLIVAILLFCANLFFWLIAHASGHNIPLKTDVIFAATSLMLLVMIIFLVIKKIELKNR
jgi:hypothetical protein